VRGDQAGYFAVVELAKGPPDTPCAGCPSPILPGCPRFSEVLVDYNGFIDGVREYHPGCWEAELRRPEAAS
jgi:hypothetical protein